MRWTCGEEKRKYSKSKIAEVEKRNEARREGCKGTKACLSAAKKEGGERFFYKSLGNPKSSKQKKERQRTCEPWSSQRWGERGGFHVYIGWQLIWRVLLIAKKTKGAAK